MPYDSPIFVVGMPRSGTTLLQMMLSAHPRIAIAPETHFLSYWMRRHGEPELRSRRDFRRFWKDFTAHRQFEGLALDADALAERFLAGDRSPSFRVVFEGLLKAHAQRLGKCRWGEKTPAHHQHLGCLLQWYPQARVIHMLRDPRAVVASLLDVPWAPPQPELHAARWRDAVQLLGRWENDRRVGIVRYESLIADPEAVLREVCGFLGEFFDPAMLAHSATRRQPGAGDSRGRGRPGAAVTPISTDHPSKWEVRLTAREVATVEYLTRKGMDRYGYPPVTAGPGMVDWSVLMLWRLSDRLRRELERIQGRGAPAVSPKPPGTASRAGVTSAGGRSARHRRQIL